MSDAPAWTVICWQAILVFRGDVVMLGGVRFQSLVFGMGLSLQLDRVVAASQMEEARLQAVGMLHQPH